MANMASFADVEAKKRQASQLVGQALEQIEFDRVALYAAYLDWSKSTAGQIILAELFHVHMMGECHDAYEEGMRRLVIRFFERIREAPNQIGVHQ